MVYFLPRNPLSKLAWGRKVNEVSLCPVCRIIAPKDTLT